MTTTDPSINSNNHQFKHFYIIIALIAAFAGILFGFDTGVISGAILYITNYMHLTAGENGTVVGAVLLGAFIGSLFSGWITDLIGRKRLLIIDALIFIIGTAGSCLSNTMITLFISRLIVGVAIGISSYIAPLYISEISPREKRGALVSLNQLAISVGILISYITNYFIANHFLPDVAWRWMFAVGIIPAVLLLFGMLLLPYSPRWMLTRGKDQQALDILGKIHLDNNKVKQEYALIKASLQHQRGTLKTLFSKTFGPAILIGAGLAFLQQVTGINTIIYYAPTIFKLAGFHSATSAIYASISVGIVFVVFTLIALPLIDSLGRRPLLFIGVTAMSLSLAALSYTFHIHATNQFLKISAMISMLVFIAGFAISLGPIMWLMISEVFPLKVRGIGSSLATSVNWGSNWLVANTFLLIVTAWSASGAFFIYFIVSIIALLFIYYCVPETKGISLEQIEENLYAGKPSRYLGKNR